MTSNDERIPDLQEAEAELINAVGQWQSEFDMYGGIPDPVFRDNIVKFAFEYYDAWRAARAEHAQPVTEEWLREQGWERVENAPGRQYEYDLCHPFGQRLVISFVSRGDTWLFVRDVHQIRLVDNPTRGQVLRLVEALT